MKRGYESERFVACRGNRAKEIKLCRVFIGCIWCKNVLDREVGGAGGGKRPEGLETFAASVPAKDDVWLDPTRCNFIHELYHSHRN